MGRFARTRKDICHLHMPQSPIIVTIVVVFSDVSFFFLYSQRDIARLLLKIQTRVTEWGHCQSRTKLMSADIVDLP